MIHNLLLELVVLPNVLALALNQVNYIQPCSSYECHLTYGAVFGLSNRNFLTI